MLTSCCSNRVTIACHETGPPGNFGGRPGSMASASSPNLDSAKFISLTEAASSSQGGTWSRQVVVPQTSALADQQRDASFEKSSMIQIGEVLPQTRSSDTSVSRGVMQDGSCALSKKLYLIHNPSHSLPLAMLPESDHGSNASSGPPQTVSLFKFRNSS